VSAIAHRAPSDDDKNRRRTRQAYQPRSIAGHRYQVRGRAARNKGAVSRYRGLSNVHEGKKRRLTPVGILREREIARIRLVEALKYSLCERALRSDTGLLLEYHLL